MTSEERARDYANANKCSFCSAVKYGVKDLKDCTEKKCDRAEKKAYMSSLDAYRYGAEENTET